MLTVKLTKTSNNENKLRSNVIEGKITHIPEVGHPFVVFAEPVESAFDMRMVRTSLVQSVDYNAEARTFTVQTLNSQYSVEVFGDKDPMEYRRFTN